MQSHSRSNDHTPDTEWRVPPGQGRSQSQHTAGERPLLDVSVSPVQTTSGTIRTGSHNPAESVPRPRVSPAQSPLEAAASPGPLEVVNALECGSPALLMKLAC